MISKPTEQVVLDSHINMFTQLALTNSDWSNMNTKCRFWLLLHERFLYFNFYFSHWSEVVWAEK